MKKPPKNLSKKTAKFIKPINELKLKVGSGGIPQKNIEKAQLAIETFEGNFSPIAKNLLSQFSNAMREAEKHIETQTRFNTDPLVFPIMQLKANGGMFKYTLLSNVADICLQFMEALDEYNKDAMDVIRAHENSLRSIINNDLRGSGGIEGFKLAQELENACNRYHKKHVVLIDL